MVSLAENKSWGAKHMPRITKAAAIASGKVTHNFAFFMNHLEN
jgi:hypothetical protein